MTRTKQQLTRDRIRLQNQSEGFLEEARIKLFSHVSDLLRVSARRMPEAVADWQSEAVAIAQLKDPDCGPARRAWRTR
jgi:hypothetical protein